MRRNFRKLRNALAERTLNVEQRELQYSALEVQVKCQSTLAHGHNFHLYHEALDEDYVYLELEGTKFEASYNRVMVPIPVHVWEVVRRYPGIDLEHAEKTDTEIREYVEQEVDKRLKLYEEAGERSKALVSLSGSLAFGTADRPRAEQVAAGVEYFTRVREHQRQIKSAIEELEQTNSKKKKPEPYSKDESAT